MHEKHYIQSKQTQFQELQLLNVLFCNNVIQNVDLTHFVFGIFGIFVGFGFLRSDFDFITSLDSRSACLKWLTSLLTWAASCLRSRKGNAKDWLQILQTCFDVPPSRDRLWMDAMWYNRWFFCTNVLSHCLQACCRSFRWVK